MFNYKIDTFCDGGYCSNTYLISFDDNCIIIDPSNNLKTIKRFIGEKKLLGIFLTHAHYDHFITLLDFLNEYSTSLYLHQNAVNKVNNPDLSCASLFMVKSLPVVDSSKMVILKGNEQINFNSLKVSVNHLPGHSNCSIAIRINNDIFIGDVLFDNSIGRYDLPTGNYLTLKQSLEKIKKLKGDITFYPGHGDAFTLNDALKYNHYLR